MLPNLQPKRGSLNLQNVFYPSSPYLSESLIPTRIQSCLNSKQMANSVVVMLAFCSREALLRPHLLSARVLALTIRRYKPQPCHNRH